MNYQRIYNEIISNAVIRNSQKSDSVYTESHHIIPKCLGGTDTESNIVNLTAREHFIAHYLLAKIHGGSLWFPICSFRSNGRYPNGRLYQYAKTQQSNVCKLRRHTEETKEKIRAANINQGKWKGDLNPSRIDHPKGMLNKTHSKSTKIKMKEAKLNKPRSGFEYQWITPCGIFITREDAAIANSIDKLTVRYRCFSKLDKWVDWIAVKL